jgi:hypothetical protein
VMVAGALPAQPTIRLITGSNMPASRITPK